MPLAQVCRHLHHGAYGGRSPSSILKKKSKSLRPISQDVRLYLSIPAAMLAMSYEIRKMRSVPTHGSDWHFWQYASHSRLPYSPASDRIESRALRTHYYCCTAHAVLGEFSECAVHRCSRARPIRRWRRQPARDDYCCTRSRLTVARLLVLQIRG